MKTVAVWVQIFQVMVPWGAVFPPEAASNCRGNQVGLVSILAFPGETHEHGHPLGEVKG